MFSSKIQRYVKSKMRRRWRLMRATDFHSLMRPCFVISRFLAIFPYEINDSTFKFSKPRYVLSTVTICVCCVFSLIFVYSFVVSKTLTLGSTTKNLEVLFYISFSAFVAFITFILSGPRMRLLQTIFDISSQLSSKSYQELSILIHFKDIFGTILLIVQGFMYFYKVQKIQVDWTNVVGIILGTYVILVGYQINMLYINCVCILKACFKSINDNLARMQRILVNDMKQNVLSAFCHVQRNQFLLKELKTLKKQHLTISETVQMLNIIFSLQLLATVVMSFCEITFEVYSYVVSWQNGLLIKLNWNLLDVFSISMTHYVLKITLIVWACETGKNQAQEIGITIHSVLNSTKNEEIKDELELFSIQILHCKNTFSAKGLAMDATLLTVFVGHSTTYLLILIQFLIASHSCENL